MKSLKPSYPSPFSLKEKGSRTQNPSPSGLPLIPILFLCRKSLAIPLNPP